MAAGPLRRRSLNSGRPGDGPLHGSPCVMGAAAESWNRKQDVVDPGGVLPACGGIILAVLPRERPNARLDRERDSLPAQLTRPFGFDLTVDAETQQVAVALAGDLSPEADLPGPVSR